MSRRPPPSGTRTSQEIDRPSRRRTRRPRRPRDAALAAVLAVTVTAAGFAQDVDPDRAADVKAAFLLNFLRFTTWSASSFDDAGEPYRVTLVDGDRIADRFEEIALRAGAINGREVTVDRIDRSDTVDAADVAERLRRSHVVYVGDAVPARTRIVLDTVAGHDVLTVGDLADFAAIGGMIGLRRDGDRIVFDANPEAIRASGLMVSSRVLKLAHIVGGIKVDR